MPFLRVPSKALIDALGWDVILEIDRYIEDVAEEIRAERRRLVATQHQVLFAPGREADMLAEALRLEDVLILDSRGFSTYRTRNGRALRSVPEMK